MNYQIIVAGGVVNVLKVPQGIIMIPLNDLPPSESFTMTLIELVREDGTKADDAESHVFADIPALLDWLNRDFKAAHSLQSDFNRSPKGINYYNSDGFVSGRIVVAYEWGVFDITFDFTFDA